MQHYNGLPENVLLNGDEVEFEALHFDTLEEMVAWAKSQGAEYITFGNYHDGALWIADHASVDEQGRTRVALNHFHSGPASGPSGRNQGWTCGNSFTLCWDRHDIAPRNDDYRTGVTQLDFCHFDVMFGLEYVQNAMQVNDQKAQE